MKIDLMKSNKTYLEYSSMINLPHEDHLKYIEKCVKESLRLWRLESSKNITISAGGFGMGILRIYKPEE